jgi:ABC-2 type transport system permease protein
VTSPSERARVLRAFAYLRVTTLRNAARMQVQRLRQPKYLIGAVILSLYVVMMALGASRGSGRWSIPPELLPLLAGITAICVLGAVLTAWLLPGNRAAVAFSEAEVAFLFPAPLSRVALINFSLLRSQVVIALSAFLLAVVLGRGRGLPGNALQHAIGLWLVMATLRLHFLGASFVHERLFDAGWKPWLRRTVGFVLLLGLVVGLAGWLGLQVRPPGREDFASMQALALWLGPVLETPPANVVIAPFLWLVAPLFAGGSAAAWALSLLPALALLGLHYLWVVRSHVAFEEASIDRARHRAERAQAIRDGKSLFRTSGPTARPPVFALAPRGFAPVAFLWKGLIAAGPLARPRHALAVAGVAAAVLLFAARSPWGAAVGIFAGALFAVAAWAPMIGPMVAQRSLRETLETLDIFKAAPVPGWQVALGQMLAPVVLTIAAQWLALGVSVLAFTAVGHPPWVFGATVVVGVVGLLVVSPPLAMLVLSLPFAGVLWFPAWAPAISSRGGGFEVAGQRLVFGVMFFVVLAIALLPAGAAALSVWALGGLVGWPDAGLLCGAFAAAAVIVGELWFVVRGLGHRIDHFDLSAEAR